jgi:ankyrin repeat protein
LLILHGANLNPDSTGLFDTPLAMALHFKWYDIFQLMLSKGARVDPSDPSCLTVGNILITASNSVDMTRRILDMGVDANAPGVFVKPFGEEDLPATRFSNALQAAAFSNNPGVVELLLDRNSDLKITGPPYGNALYAVAGRIISDQYVSDSDVSKALKICKMLLAKGAK